MRKPTICIREKKTQISFAVTAKLISVFVFATWIVQYLYFLNTKFQASSHLQWLHSLVCVRPRQNPHCWFSRVAAHFLIVHGYGDVGIVPSCHFWPIERTVSNEHHFQQIFIHITTVVTGSLYLTFKVKPHWGIVFLIRKDSIPYHIISCHYVLSPGPNGNWTNYPQISAITKYCSTMANNSDKQAFSWCCE